MDENINTSAEIQEVAEPETEALESAETQEVAEPDEANDSTEVVEENADEAEEEPRGKNDADAAFAEMRRNNEALRRENEMLMDALGNYFEGDTAEELSINAGAYANDQDPDDFRAEWERAKEFEGLKEENEVLKNQLVEVEIDRRMQEGLREIQEIDPNIESLDELGPSFINMVRAGLTNKEAYFATITMNARAKVMPPDDIGRVADNRVERDYYTSEEIDHMSRTEIRENWDKVMRSLEKMSKK